MIMNRCSLAASPDESRNREAVIGLDVQDMLAVNARINSRPPAGGRTIRTSGTEFIVY